MSTHGPEYKNGGPPAYRPLDERVEDLESRADASDERADAADKAIEERDAKLIVVLGQLMQTSQRTEATAKAGLDVATLLAEQFHAMRGTVTTTHEDTIAVQRGLAAIQTRVASVETKQTETAAIVAGPHSERPSFHDLDDVARKTIMQSNQEAKTIAENAARTIAEEVAKRHRLESDLQRSEEARAKAESALATRDGHAHGYKLIGFNRLIGASGAIIVGAVWLLWFLLTHH